MAVVKPITIDSNGNKTEIPSGDTLKASALNLDPTTGDISSPSNGDVWYNNTTSKFRGRQGGTTVDLVGGGSGSPGGSDTQIQYNNAGSFAGSANLVWDNTTPKLTVTGKFEVVAGTLVDTVAGFKYSATMPTTITASNNAIDFQITSAGSSAFSTNSYNITYLAGYTGPNNTGGLNVQNSVAGTGTFIFGSRNQGIFGQASATTTGTNIGVYGSGANGDLNIGVVGRAIIAKNSATNIGVLGMAVNTGTTPVQIGGYFGLQNANPSFTSCALMCDNGSTTSDIFNGRDNGTITFCIIDGGNVGIFQQRPTSRLHINFDQNSVTQADANGILLGNASAATAGTQSISPGIVWQGNGWKTTATAGSQDVRFRADMLPVQGTTNPAATWQLASSINGAAYVTAITVNTSTGVTITPAMTVTGNATFNGDIIKGGFRVGGNNTSMSNHLLLGVADTNTQSYKLTNGGGQITGKLFAYSSISTAGTNGVILDPTNSNGIVLSAGNGTTHIARASINITNLTNTAGSEAGDMIFSTQNGGAGLTQHMRISKAGNIVCGNEAALATNATDGFLYIPSCNGTPTGVPTTYTGKVPIIIDKTNNILYIYNGGWKGATVPGVFS